MRAFVLAPLAVTLYYVCGRVRGPLTLAQHLPDASRRTVGYAPFFF